MCVFWFTARLGDIFITSYQAAWIRYLAYQDMGQSGH